MDKSKKSYFIPRTPPPTREGTERLRNEFAEAVQRASKQSNVNPETRVKSSR